MVALLWKSGGFYKVKMHLSHYPAIPLLMFPFLLRVYQDLHKDLYKNVHGSLTHNSPKQETSQFYPFAPT